jgi:hypothetical protein
MRGGRRPGAGRKRGSVTKKTREVAVEAAKQGISPADVMLEAMRQQYSLARDASEPEIKALFLSRAAQIAKDVAPYVHPRITPVEPRKDDAGEAAPAMSENEILRRLVFTFLRAHDNPATE